MGKSKKFYVVWVGRSKGVYDSWATCKKQVDGFEGAKYKSFTNKTAAEEALQKSFKDYIGLDTTKSLISKKDLEKYGVPILDSIAVDAACAGNPGVMEYRGVFTNSKKEIFRMGPFSNGTNNIGEFLALVHALALLKSKKKEGILVYSDSKIAMGWVQKKRCNTNVKFDHSNREILELIKRAETWLEKNTYSTKILKWQTKVWGEIPADFGRK